jgi:hypothetical protein
MGNAEEIISRYNQAKMQSISLKSSITNTKRVLSQFKLNYEEKKKEYEELTKKSTLQEEGLNLLKNLIQTMATEHINEAANFINEGLKTIFYDKEYKIEIEIEDKRNLKQANLYLIEKNGEDILKSSLKDSVGGGVLVTIGFLFQVFYIQYHGLSPIIFLDEAFTQLSDKYIIYLKMFIEDIAKRLGFIFVLITHDERLMHNAVKTYEVEGGRYHELN